jgi:hypothetical protein
MTRTILGKAERISDVEEREIIGWVLGLPVYRRRKRFFSLVAQ